jgi:predicted GIY-YIG superfamily endonuclease
VKSDAEKDRSSKNKSHSSPWFVYIVRCGDGSLYTGITTDVNRRCRQHNAGTASRYTRTRCPVKLVYQEVRRNQSSALKREVAIKAMTRPAKLAMIRLSKKSMKA